MKNIRKIGLSALAGSLAMFSAAQAEMSISGSAEMTYTSSEGTGGASSASQTGNPFGMEHAINFTGSGELDNGFTYSVNSNIAGNDMANDSTILTMDMGALGSIGFDQGVGSYGIASLENNVPTAYEEADHNVGTIGHAIDAQGNTNVIGYKNSFAGVGVNVRFNPTAGNTTKNLAGVAGGTSDASELSWALSSAVPGFDGLSVALGHAKTDFTTATANDSEELTASINYAAGPVSVGYQQSEVQSGTAGANGYNVTAYGIAFNVNENMSISYSVNEAEVDKPSSTNVTEESTGIQAAYTMGSASLRVAFNEADGVNGVAADTKESTEISLALAF
jgi:outer membrane protein OmpU